MKRKQAPILKTIGTKIIVDKQTQNMYNMSVQILTEGSADLIPENLILEAEDATDETEEVDDTNQFAALSKDLYKLGVFSKEDDEEDTPIDTPEAFLERFNAEKKKGAIEIVNNFIGQFGEDYQNAFDAIFVKGVDPKEYFGAYNNVVSFSEMDLSQENNQVAVIKQALADQGFEPEDINTEVERLKNYGDLETVATKHHKVLVKKEAQKLAHMEQVAHLKEKFEMGHGHANALVAVFRKKNGL